MSDEVKRATAAILQMEAKQPRADGVRSVFALPPTRDYSSAPISWVVDGIVAEGTVTLLSGDSGSGKTTLVTAMAEAVSRGGTFAGYSTSQRPVLMLDRENPLSVVRERLERLGIEDGEAFRVWGGWVEGEVPTINSPVVLDFIKASDPKPLIVVDSLVSYLEGSENDAAEVRANMNAYRAAANMGSTVIVLHHSGKGESSSEYRGSSDIKASIDLGYKLVNLGDPSRLSMLRLKAFKSRFTTSTEVILDYRDGQFMGGAERAKPTVDEMLVGLLKRHPGVKTAEFEQLAVEQGLGRNKARLFLLNGVDSGRVTRINAGRNYRAYRLAEEAGQGVFDDAD